MNILNSFISAVIHNVFLQNALIVSVLSSVAFGITGPFVVKKRLSYVAGGIAHAVMGGIGVAYYFHANTTIGAIISAVIFSLILTIIKSDSKQKEDTLVGTLWAIGMSIGIIFVYLTPGYNADLTSFIFGNILMVNSSDIFIIFILDVVLIISVVGLYYHFIFLSFDEKFLSVRGLKVRTIYFLLLLMISITVVITIKSVGLILVIALITLPAITAEFFVHKMGSLFVLTIFFGIIFSVIGIFAAYSMNIPASASIILLAGGCYFIIFLLKQIMKAV